MQKLKKRFIVPVVVFILGMCALIGTIYVVGEGQEEQNRTKAQLNAMTYAAVSYTHLDVYKRQVMEITQKSRTTAWRYMKTLVELGVVEAEGNTNNMIYKRGDQRG